MATALPAAASPARVLIVDDDHAVLRILHRVLVHFGASVDQAGCAEAAIGALARADYDVVLCDLNLPRVDGLALLRHARGAVDPPAVVLMSGAVPVSRAASVVAEGAFCFLLKPIMPASLHDVVARAAAKRRRGSLRPPPIDRSPSPSPMRFSR